MPIALNVPVREHFSSPLLQYAEADGGKTFTLVECPSKCAPFTPSYETAQPDLTF